MNLKGQEESCYQKDVETSKPMFDICSEKIQHWFNCWDGDGQFVCHAGYKMDKTQLIKKEEWTWQSVKSWWQTIIHTHMLKGKRDATNPCTTIPPVYAVWGLMQFVAPITNSKWDSATELASGMAVDFSSHQGWAIVNQLFGFVIVHMYVHANVCLNICIESRMIAHPEASYDVFLDVYFFFSPPVTHVLCMR